MNGNRTMSHQRTPTTVPLLAALALAAITVAGCKEQAQSNPLPTIRLGTASVASGTLGSTGAKLVDRDTTTWVRFDRPTTFTLTLAHGAELRRVKVFGAGVKVSVAGAPDIVLDGGTPGWGSASMGSPSTVSQVEVTVTPMSGAGSVAEVELWGAGLAQAPRDALALAEATKSTKAAFEDALVLRATPEALTLRPGSAGPGCLEATLPPSNPRAARRAYLAYESTARRSVVLSRSVDGQPA